MLTLCEWYIFPRITRPRALPLALFYRLALLVAQRLTDTD